MFFNSNKEVSYHSEIIWDLDESEEMHNILAQTKIDKRTAENLEGAMKLVYKNGIAKEVIWIEEGEYEDPDDARYTISPVKYINYPINKYKILVPVPTGKHKIGGKSVDFLMPKTEDIASLIYLGFIDISKEESLQWTSLFKFHLIYPIAMNVETIYFDYKDPNKPTLFKVDELDLIQKLSTYKFDNLVSFKEQYYDFKALTLDDIYERTIIGNIGAPSYLQDSSIPKCPKSGKPMKFLVKFESNRHLNLHSNSQENSDMDTDVFVQKFNEYASGYLFVFYSPESMVAAYFFQHT